VQIVAKVVGGAYASDGGSASVQPAAPDSANRCGVTACVLTLTYQQGVGYLAELSLVPGSYLVTYAPPTGYRLAEGVADPMTVTVSTGAPQMMVTFTLTP